MRIGSRPFTAVLSVLLALVLSLVAAPAFAEPTDPIDVGTEPDLRAHVHDVVWDFDPSGPWVDLHLGADLADGYSWAHIEVRSSDGREWEVGQLDTQTAVSLGYGGGFYAPEGGVVFGIYVTAGDGSWKGPFAPYTTPFTGPLTVAAQVNFDHPVIEVGDTLTTTFTVANMSDHPVVVPDSGDVYIRAWRASGADNDVISAPCEGAGWGVSEDESEMFRGYELPLPDVVPAGASYTCTLTQTVTEADVEVGGTWGYISYGGAVTDWDNLSYEYGSAGVGADPFIFNPATVGSTLREFDGRWTTGTSVTRQWYANGIAIPGATGPAYVIPSTMLGKSFTLKVTGTMPGFAPVVKESAPTLKVPRTAVPTISGSAKVGATLTAKPGAWSTSTTFLYQWYANGAKISGATKPTYTIPSSLMGKSLTVKVAGKKSGYTTVSLASKATLKVPRTAVPTISGTVKVGAKVTAKPGTWSTGTTFTYQWYASGKAIRGATKSTYVIPSSLRGRYLTVKVTGKKSGYTTVARLSATKKVV